MSHNRYGVSAMRQRLESQEGYFYSEGEVGASEAQEGCEERRRERRAIFLLCRRAVCLAVFGLKISHCCTDTKDSPEQVP